MRIEEFKAHGFELPRIKIPYFSDIGKPIDFCRERFHPDHLPVIDGKPVKYKQPPGVPPQAYLPPFVPGSWREIGRDTKRPVLLTEGEFKAACATRHGFATIGLGGVDCWPAPNLDGFEWQGRPVVIAFDSDAEQNGNVRRAEKRAAQWLRSKGAVVRVLRLPSDGSAKVGLDDFIAAHGAKALRALLDAPDAASPAPLLSPGAPLESAEEFLAAAWTREGRRALHHWHGAFYAWRGSHYAAVEDGEMRAKAYAFLAAAVTINADGDLEPFRPTQRRVNDVLDALKGLCNLPGSNVAPCWIEPRRDAPAARELVAVRNGLLHLPTRRLLPHGPDFFSLNALDFDYDERAAKPRRWLAFLDSLWKQDPESIAALQEFIGGYISGDGSQQKILLIEGPKRAGKSTIAEAVAALVGKDNVAHPSINALAERFGQAPLIGKALAIIPDARFGGRADQQALAERLLSISGQDAVTIDRKFCEPWTGRLGVQFLMISNEVPRIADASSALASRFIVLKLTRSFYGKEDLGLAAALRAELPGIFLWALEGLRRLRKRGHFVQPESAREDVELLADLGSPISAFLRDRCEVGSAQRVQRGILYANWLAWCQGHGRAHPGTLEMFGRDLRAQLPALRDAHVREDGKRARYYVGVGLSAGTGDKASEQPVAQRAARRSPPPARGEASAACATSGRLHSGAGTGGTGKKHTAASTKKEKAKKA